MFEHLKSGGRLNIGERMIRPTGEARCLGPRGCSRPVVSRTVEPQRGLGRLKWDAPLRSATIIIGQKRGLEEHNKTGECAAAPEQYSSRTIDRWFARVRGGQTGHEHFGATAIDGRGWYEGQAEPSVSYQIVHDPSVPGEETFAKFKERIESVAEELAEIFCQDSVLAIFDTERGKHTYAYEYDPKTDKDGRRDVAIPDADELVTPAPAPPKRKPTAKKRRPSARRKR